MSIGQTIHTIRYLRTGQAAAQIRHRLRPFWERPETFFCQPVPDMDVLLWPENRSFLPPGPQAGKAEAVRRGDFEFLNHEEHLGWPPSDWDLAGLPKLWRYNLDYFEWLWGLGYGDVRECVLSWIGQHPLGRDCVGWESYPLSLRLLNWCAVCFGKFRSETEADPEFIQSLWQSIYPQAEWLCRHLETHLLGNHLFENGAALAFVGSCFGGAAGDKWLQRGLHILEREIPEQILPDGMHFERSPMYHTRITYLLRLLLDTGNEILRALIADPLARARKALACLCHPDGEIALLNDAALGVYNEPGELLGPDRWLQSGPWALSDAGYYGWRGDDGSYIICDAGEIGPDYIPGHAHGDMFSFELSLKGQRVIVDSGVYNYVPGPMRQYCRSTRAHNTVEVNGVDQCEFWSAFRVARRGRPRDVEWQAEADGFRLRGWHDGYRRLAGRPEHQRTITWKTPNRLEVRDRVRSSKQVSAVSWLHFHPACSIEHIDAHKASVGFPGGRVQITFEGGQLLRMEDSFYCREFGRKEANVALAYAHNGAETETGFTILLV